MAKQAPILVAEDEEDDVFFLRHAVAKSGLPIQLIVARDGQEAIEYLQGKGPLSDRAQHPLPKLLLLDLKMPRLSGFDVLAWLSTHPELKNLPSIVLSSSSNPADIQRARDMGAREYRVKPSNAEELVGLVQQLHSRWLSQPPQLVDG